MIVSAEDLKPSVPGPVKQPPLDVPPSYDASQSSAPGPSELNAPAPLSSASSPPPSPLSPALSSKPPSKPMNHVSTIKHSGSVKGRWVIDPSLPIPAPFLSPFEPGSPTSSKAQKNLCLKTHSGNIRADVTILPSIPIGDSGGEQRAAAVFEATTGTGAVHFDLHDGPQDSTKTRVPVKIQLFSSNGSITIGIPRSFRGVIKSECWLGTAKVSDAVGSQIKFSQRESRVRRLFIGDFDESDFSQQTWAGDEIKAETRVGSIRVYYDDEVRVPVTGLEGWWSKVWTGLVVEPVLLLSRVQEGALRLV